MSLRDITVVIPAFNASDTISETLWSVAAQSVCPARVIVVDDGSTDGTASIAGAHPLAPQVLAQPNTGTAAAMNRAVALARGGLVAFLDADDLWLPDKLELQLAALDERANLDAVLGHFESFICPSISQQDSRRLPVSDGPRPGFLLGCLLIRRASFDRVGAFNADLRTSFFIDWWSRAIDAKLQYSMLSETVLRRRLRPGTLSFRSGPRGDQIGKDALAIARDTILRRRRRAQP